MKRFEKKTVIVTGAGSGIGSACAQRLGSEGARILALDLSQDNLETLSSQLTGENVEHLIRTCDVSNEAQVEEAVAACIEAYGGIDVLVHMAGMLRWDNTHELDLTSWKRLIDVNVTGTFIINKAVLPYLIESKGNIVNAASTASHNGLPHAAAYSASKGAVRFFTRAIAVEYGKRGVRANTVSPGDISTNMTADIAFPEGMDMTLLARSQSLSGSAPPEDVANVVALLASNEGRHITGEDIRVDGGTLA